MEALGAQNLPIQWLLQCQLHESLTYRGLKEIMKEEIFVSGYALRLTRYDLVLFSNWQIIILC